MCKLHPKCLCMQCLGCMQLEKADFTGKFNCHRFIPSNKKVWCADESVNKFIKTGKVK